MCINYWLNKLVELSTKERFLLLQTRGYDIKQWFLNWNDFCPPRDNSQCLKMILVVTTWVVGAMGYGDLLPAPTRVQTRFCWTSSSAQESSSQQIIISQNISSTEDKRGMTVSPGNRKSYWGCSNVLRMKDEPKWSN